MGEAPKEAHIVSYERTVQKILFWRELYVHYSTNLPFTLADAFAVLVGYNFRQKLLLLAKSTTSLSSNASSSVKANAANAAASLNPSDPNYFGSPYRDGIPVAV